MDDAKLLARVAEIYAKALAEDSPGRRWLAERGLTNVAVLEKLGVGWADGNLAAITPKGDVADRLRALGLMGPEMPAGSVTVPLTDALGQLVAIWAGGRVAGVARGGWLNAEALRVHSAVAITTDPIEALKLTFRTSPGRYLRIIPRACVYANWKSRGVTPRRRSSRRCSRVSSGE